jgi:hypothetical protein
MRPVEPWGRGGGRVAEAGDVGQGPGTWGRGPGRGTDLTMPRTLGRPRWAHSRSIHVTPLVPAEICVVISAEPAEPPAPPAEPALKPNQPTQSMEPPIMV